MLRAMPKKSTFPAAKLPEDWIVPMRRLFLLLLVFAPVIAAEAHLGNENNTEVRVYSDRMRVVVRTSIPFAWTILGEQAPALADEAGQVIAKPLLAAAAADLLKITAGGEPMIPESTDCVFEVQNDVAFVLNFKRPQEWPVVVETRFLGRFTTLDSGTIAIFDYTASRFSRDLEPIAKGVIDLRNPSLSFTLEADASSVPTPEATTVAPPPAATPSASPIRVFTAASLLLLALGVVGFLAYRRLREEA